MRSLYSVLVYNDTAKALRICSGAMVGTPTSPVQVECGQPPLALRRLRMAADYAVKIKGTPEHPTASTLDDCWSNHYGNYSAGREPFGVKVTRVLEEAGVNVIPPVPTSIAPWIQSLRPDRSYLKPLQDKNRNYVTDQSQVLPRAPSDSEQQSEAPGSPVQ